MDGQGVQDGLPAVDPASGVGPVLSLFDSGQVDTVTAAVRSGNGRVGRPLSGQGIQAPRSVRRVDDFAELNRRGTRGTEWNLPMWV